MASAARGGNIGIVRKMLDLGADYYNQALIDAARWGHLDIIELMLNLWQKTDSGAIDYEGALVEAHKWNYHDQVGELFLKHNIRVWSELGARFIINP